MTMNEERYAKFAERYAQGAVPWDNELPPPEIIDLVEGLPPGRALDLGCGYGRTAIYLARHGWQVDGVDFVPQAVAEAQRRAAAAGVSGSSRFFVGSVARLDFLTPPYTLAVDVGCMHALDEVEQAAYRDELLRLLSAGAQYVLFAHIRDEADAAENGPRGVPETAVRRLFAAEFELEQVEHGITQVEDKPPWRSAWFWFRRR